MYPQQTSEHPDRIWMVAHWKWELDPNTPWYRCWFFKYIFRPFVHFSWKVMKIPCPKGIEANGSKVTIFWFENGGFFSSEDQADIACINQWHGYKDVPLDRSFPIESCQYSSLVFPRQKDKRQRRTPTFSTIAKDRKQDEQEKQSLAQALNKLNQVLSR